MSRLQWSLLDSREHYEDRLKHTNMMSHITQIAQDDNGNTHTVHSNQVHKRSLKSQLMYMGNNVHIISASLKCIGFCIYAISVTIFSHYIIQ